MRLNKFALALSLAAFALPLSALAQETTEPATDAPAAAEEEASSNLSWNLSVTSDYVFRGITQTDFDPALQGGLDYAFGDSGFYIGGWASNVDFADPDGNGPDIEFDATAGWGTNLNDDWSIDFHVVRYTYFGERDVYGSTDYTEFFAKTSYKEMLTFTVAYADDYANLGYSSLYYNLGGAWELGHGFSLNAGVGYSDFSDDNGSYTDWNLGVSHQWGPANFALNYYDTDIDGDNTSDTFVLTVGFGG